jgi:hypothetical protein
MGGGDVDARGPTAVVARRGVRPARAVLAAAVLAASAGLVCGLLVGWSIARRAAPPMAPVIARDLPPPPRVLAPPPRRLDVPARTEAGTAVPRPHRRRRGVVPAAAETPWWSTVVGDNPYR